jgi:hypothetical protein
VKLYLPAKVLKMRLTQVSDAALCSRKLGEKVSTGDYTTSTKSIL